MANKRYPGKLGQRSHDIAPSRPPTTALGGEPSKEVLAEYERASNEWTRRQVLRMLDGISQLLDYYEIEDTEDRFALLAFSLARDHVPYCMNPVSSRGRPKKTQPLIPIADDMAKLAKAAGQTQKSAFEVFAKTLKIDESTVVREVKRFRATKKSGKKKK